ncbi:MAG: phage distal tail protein, partial [Oscillospiraceae bacterium]
MTIKNLDTGKSVIFGDLFLLSKVDWGNAPATHSKTKGNEQIGSSIDNTSLESRTITIVGYINMRGAKGMESQKQKISSLVNPFQRLQVSTGSRKITGKPTTTIKESTDRKDNNSNLFKFTFSLLCAYPLFELLQELRDDIAIWMGGFEFPLCIDEEEGIEFSIRTMELIATVENAGDVPLGMVIRFSATGTVENPSITNINTREYIALNFTMQAGDVITVNT